MDGVFVLLGFAVLAVPVCVVILLVGQSRLKTRVAGLERRLADLTQAPVDAVASVHIATPAASVDPVLPVTMAVLPPDIADPTATASEDAAALPDQNRPLVIRRDRAAALGGWLARNWVYVVSAASLALAGVFLVQYGIQNGLLPPWLRVFAAYGFGAALIAAAEVIRRRSGDTESSDTAYLPSVFAGAGIVSLFAATIAARQLYDLIGPDMAFVLHMITAAVAIALGWVYGPLLVAVGLTGAAAAPFLVGSGAGPTPLLYGYYALIAATGLAVDAVRRWAWVSVLALVLAYGGGWLMLQAGAGQAGWIACVAALAALSITLPVLRLIPDHPDPATLSALIAGGKFGWPVFPTRIAAGSVLTSTAALLLMTETTPTVALLTCATLTLIALALLLWADKAEGLADLALLPALAVPLKLAVAAFDYAALFSQYSAKAIALRPPETAAPPDVTYLVILATAISAAFAWRSLRGGRLSVIHGLAATLVAPVTIATLELLWHPASVIGDWLWALHPMALAAAMVALAARFARDPDHRCMAYATLSALALIALALFLLTSTAALTLALAVLLLTAAALDKRFELPEMGLFIQIATAVLSYRLLIDPGLDWAAQAPLPAVIAAFVTTIAAQGFALRLLRDLPRGMTKGVLDSAALALIAVFANALLNRWLLPWLSFTGPSALDFNYATTLNALPWLVLMLTQAYRATLGGAFKRLRQIFAAVAGLLAMAGLATSAIALNPLFAAYPDGIGALVLGPLILDTLALSYAMPGLILLGAAWRLRLPRPVTLGLLITGSALLTLYITLEIRRFWQGDYLGAPGVLQYELYSYTIALMLTGAALLYQSIARRSPLLRRLGMAVIALTVAKVFLIDASGLTGLTRVFSFLGLGLSLAALAWLNRWAGQVAQTPEAPPPI